MKEYIPRDACDKLWNAEYRNCPICNSGEFKVVGMRGGDAHRDGKGVKTQVVCCSVCSVLYAFPMMIPVSNPYDRYSAAEYFEKVDSKERYSEGNSLAIFAEKIFGKPGRLLDLGCGRGELGLSAAGRGWEVQGVEVAADYVTVARKNGLDVEHSNAQDCKSLDLKYDVVLMSAIFEHLYSPVDILRRVHKSLNNNGLLFLSVPNEYSLASIIGNLYLNVTGKDVVVNLSPTFPPFHVVGFSRKSLRYVLEKNGFHIHTMTTRKVRNDMPKDKKIIRRIERFSLSFFQRIGASIGMGDEILCWAIKKN